MKILIYDYATTENDIYDLISNHTDIKFIKIDTEKDFYSLYEKDSYYLIIIDVSKNDGEDIFNYISKIKPKQRIIVLSNRLTYNHSFTCKQCDETFNRKLLLKPLNPKELITYIQNFDNLLCKYSSNSNNIIEIMEEILKQFVNYEYNIEKRTPGFVKMKIKGIYLRIWIFKKVFLISIPNGLIIQNKNRHNFKLLIGLSGIS